MGEQDRGDTIKEIHDNDKLTSGLELAINKQILKIAGILFGVGVTVVGAAAFIVFQGLVESSALELSGARVAGELIDNDDFMSVIATRTTPVPENAIITIASEDGCPRGWSIYEPALGRVIVGVGQGNQMSNRAYRDTGGQQFTDKVVNHTHEVEYQDMAAAKHVNNPDGGLVPNGTYMNTSVLVLYDGPKKLPNTKKPSGNIGVDRVDNMPPFVALYFCKKDK